MIGKTMSRRMCSAAASGFFLAVFCGVAGAQAPRPANVETKAEFVALGRALSTAVYRPASGPAPRVAIIYQNGGSSSMSHPACAGLAARGFLAVCSTSRAESGDLNLAWDTQALDVKAAVTYARSQPGISRVVLFGHSGGGGVSSFYQAVAENGVSFCQGAKKLWQCGAELAGLPPADAVVFPDAHPGMAVMDTRMINPSVSFAADGSIKIDPALDLFNPANGFNPNGPSKYSPAFQKKYFAAQAEAMNAAVDRALKAKADVEAGRIQNGLVLVPGWVRQSHLEVFDPAIKELMSTSKPRRLLRNDGTIVTQIVSSVWKVNPEARRGATGPASVHVDGYAGFLSFAGMRGTDSLTGMDYCVANTATICNVQSIRAPSLFLPMGAGQFITDNERMFEASASTDKEYLVVEGAVHGFTACKECETTPGQYGRSFDNTLDYIRDWINKRF